LYAGVDGSNGLSVSLGGRQGVVEKVGWESKFVVDEEANSETCFQSGVWWTEGSARKPIVDGNMIASVS